MKKEFKSYVTNSILVVIAIVSAWQLSSCKGDDDPTAQEVIKAKLIGSTWNVQSVKVDGIDKTSVFTGLTITFDESNFTTTHGGAVWPASGTWTFIADNGSKVKRDDGTEISVDITETTLKLTFEWAETTLGSGRSSSVKGKNVFTLTQ
jgi:hypothetical protein